AFLKDAAATRAKVKELVGDQDNPAEKVRKIYRFVQEKIGTEEARVDRTDQTAVADPNNVDDVLRRGYGDETDRTLLFMAMAREAGLPAALVAIAPRDHTVLNMNLPDPDQFDAFGAAVKTDGAGW